MLKTDSAPAARTTGTALHTIARQHAQPFHAAHWGDGRSVSADGAKWDLYEQNLLAEYHISSGATAACA